MNLGMEDEHTEHKRSTSELREGMESVASILNKHGYASSVKRTCPLARS